MPPLAHRYEDIRHCPCCGAAFAAADFDRAAHLFLCRQCGFDFYQNPLPSAVIAVARDARADAVLMIRRRTAPNIGLWCLPGGFLNYGEEPARAAEREAREEAATKVRATRILRAGLLDYAYRGRRLCIVEMAYLGELAGPPPAAGASTAEASEIAFLSATAMLAQPQMLALPEQGEVLRAFLACRR